MHKAKYQTMSFREEFGGGGSGSGPKGTTSYILMPLVLVAVNRCLVVIFVSYNKLMFPGHGHQIGAIVLG